MKFDVNVKATEYQKTNGMGICKHCDNHIVWCVTEDPDEPDRWFHDFTLRPGCDIPGLVATPEVVEE